MIALPLLELGRIHMQRDAFDQALPLLQESVRLREGGFGSAHWGTAQAQSALGACLTGLRRYDEAEPLLQDSYRYLRADQGDASEHTRTARAHLAVLYEAMGKPERAARYHTDGGSLQAAQ